MKITVLDFIVRLVLGVAFITLIFIGIALVKHYFTTQEFNQSTLSTDPVARCSFFKGTLVSTPSGGVACIRSNVVYE